MLNRIVSTAVAVALMTAAGASFAADTAKSKCQAEHKGDKAAIAKCEKDAAAK